MKLFYVYEHWRPDTDACFYVGKGHGNRCRCHKRRNKHYDNIVSKLTRLGMCVEVRLVQEGLTETIAFELEKSRIAFWRNLGVPLCNQTEGGEGISGYHFTPESYAKSLNARSEFFDRIRGEKRDPEIGRKISKTKKSKGNLISEQLRKRKHSEETKRKMSETRLALLSKPDSKLFSSETRQKMSLSHNRQPRTPEVRARISAKMRAVWQLRHEQTSGENVNG